MAKISWIIPALAGLTATPCHAQGEDLMRDHYPARALQLGVEGMAMINCDVTPQGRLSGCVVVSETPPDFGFGDAALKMSPFFKMRPLKREDGSTDDGGGIDGRKVTVPIRFKLGEQKW